MSRLFTSPVTRVALVALLVAAVALIFRDSFASMVALWPLSSYQHSFFVAPMSLLLVWMARRQFAAVPLLGSGLGLALLALLAVLWLGARASAVQAAEHVAIVGMAIAFVLAALGWPAFRTIAFPIFFLSATAPVGEELIPVLLEATADVSEWLLRLLGVPVLREGMFFALPGGNFEVAEICSGLRYLMAGTVTALLFAYLNFNSWGKRIAFTLVSAVSFVFANGVRAFITMAVASATNGRLMVGEDHVWFGLVLFAVLLVVLLWAGMKLADPLPPKAEIAPVDPTLNRMTRVGVCTVVGLGLMGGAAALQASHEATGSELLGARLPGLQGCTGPADWAAPWDPEVIGADVVTAASYRCGEMQVHVYLASYGHQAQGKELISDQNHLVPFDWRQFTRRGTAILDLAAGKKVDLDETRVDIVGRNVLAWHWYDVNGRSSHTRGRTKLNEALQALDLRGVVSSVRMVVVTSSSDDFEAMRSLLETKVRVLWPVLAEEPRRMDGA